ncbi:MAG: hypothetical protein WD342_09200 [Verrucomicrobiales bacterium]
MTITHKVQLAFGLIIVAFLVVFLVLNRASTEVDLIVGTIVMSRALLVLGFFSAGFVVGWVTRSIVKIRLTAKKK